MKKIGFIGVGIMGKSMVRNLMKAGYEVAIYTRTRSKVEDIIGEGAIWCGSAGECAKGRQAVISIVGYPKDVEDIYFGEGGIIANADPGTYLIDMTTTSPRLAVRIYEEAKNAGLHALDAPVTGGDKGAKDGTLTILAGGDREDFDACLSILQAMGKNIDYEGKAGNGQHTNMCNQIAVAGALAGACEAGLCQECGAGCGHNAKVHFHRSRQQCADEQCGFKGVAGRLSAWILHQTFYQGYEPGR